MKHVVGFRDFSPSLIKESSSIKKEPLHLMLLENYAQTMDKLEDAIRNKFVCTIYYKGERRGILEDGYRYIEPYAVGINSRGNTVVRCWLLKGTSRTGKIDPSLVPGWRLFRVDRIASIATTLQQFNAPRKGYNPEDKKMAEVMFSAQF
jgi:predicted DNA-binding transcriptional regulator YafY